MARVYEPGLNLDIKDAVTEALRLAKEGQSSVEMVYGGIPFVVNPPSEGEDAESRLQGHIADYHLAVMDKEDFIEVARMKRKLPSVIEKGELAILEWLATFPENYKGQVSGGVSQSLQRAREGLSPPTQELIDAAIARFQSGQPLGEDIHARAESLRDARPPTTEVRVGERSLTQQAKGSVGRGNP